MSASFPDKVMGLHVLFTQITGRVEPIRFHERAWSDLLSAPEYEGDAARLCEDVKTVVRYLQKMIREGRRNPGALKLRNLLQPDQFLADLAEAKPQRPIPPPKPERAQTHQVSGADKVTVLAPVEPERTVPKISKGMMSGEIERLMQQGGAQ